MRIFTFCLLGLLFLSGCRGEDAKSRVYKNDGNISDEKGNPADSNVSYFPQKMPVEKSFFSERLSTQNDSVNYQIKKFDFASVTKQFIAFKEPVLDNYYLGKDIIRLLWTRSFHRPVMIKMERQGDAVTLTTKILNRYPELFPLKSTIKFLPPVNKSKHRKKEVIKEIPLPPQKIDVHIDLNKTTRLSPKEWETMLGKLNEIDFFHMTPYRREVGLDGSDWLLETHLSDRYHYVFRWSPHDSFQKCCEYLIGLSEVKNEERY
ncbi:MAG: hypothetical protein ACM3S2_19195 [Ignavibacteriales bacterium]